MSFSYTGPGNSDLDYVRFRLGDTRELRAMLQDDEIQWVIDQSDSDLEYAVFRCVESILPKFAQDVDYKLGPESVNASDRYKHFKDLYDQLYIKYNPGSVGYPIGAPPLDSDPIFGVGMTDNEGDD